MEQVLDVYKRPYNEKRPVVCMDESPKQIIGEIRETESMKEGKEIREDYEYVRKGLCNIFMMNEPLRVKRYVKITERKTKKDWAEFICEIESLYRNAEKITLVMDNFKTHVPGALYETFTPEKAKKIWDRFEFIYTPKHGSWLNMAELLLKYNINKCPNHADDLHSLRFTCFPFRRFLWL